MTPSQVVTRRDGRVLVATLQNPPHGLQKTGELPGYDPVAREHLLAGTYADLTEE